MAQPRVQGQARELHTVLGQLPRTRCTGKCRLAALQHIQRLLPVCRGGHLQPGQFLRRGNAPGQQLQRERCQIRLPQLRHTLLLQGSVLRRTVEPIAVARGQAPGPSGALRSGGL